MKCFTVSAFNSSVIQGITVNLEPYPHVLLGQLKNTIRIPLSQTDFSKHNCDIRQYNLDVLKLENQQYVLIKEKHSNDNRCLVKLNNQQGSLLCWDIKNNPKIKVLYYWNEFIAIGNVYQPCIQSLIIMEPNTSIGAKNLKKFIKYELKYDGDNLYLEPPEYNIDSFHPIHITDELKGIII